MKQTVIVRFGELPLKGKPVRKKFKNKLISNIRSVVGDIPLEIRTQIGRIYIKTQKAEEVSSILSKVPGIVSSSPSWKTHAKMEDIVELSREIVKESFPEKGSFAVVGKRTGKHEFNSQDIERVVGAETLKIRPNMEVDLNSPDHRLYVEVRNSDAYIFTKKIEGIGGLPAGTQGKMAVIFSDIKKGLASSYSMLKRGATVYPVGFAKESKYSKEKFLKNVKNLSKLHTKLEVINIPFNDIEEKINTEIPPEIRWIIKRRIALETLEKIADKIGAKAIVSDIDLKDISEITLNNLEIIEKCVELPVFYPLTGFDKGEISKIASQITENEVEGKGFQGLFKIPSKVKELKLDEIRKTEEKISKDTLIASALESTEVYKLE